MALLRLLPPAWKTRVRKKRNTRLRALRKFAFLISTFLLSLGSSHDGVTFGAEIFGQILFHLRGVLVRHRVQMLV